MVLKSFNGCLTIFVERITKRFLSKPNPHTIKALKLNFPYKTFYLHRIHKNCQTTNIFTFDL
jgi:hypothetical protein